MKKIVKKIIVFSMIGILNIGLGTSAIEASARHGDHNQQYDSHHDQRWHNDHDKQWRDHEREWKDHDREWKEHDGDRDWQERHAHEWKDWYRWHHDNGDDGFDAFIMGIIAGVIIGGQN